MFLIKDKFINFIKPERKILNNYIKKAEAYIWTKEQENMTDADLERITKKLRSMGMNPQQSSEGIWIAKTRVGIHAEETFQPIIVNENSYLAEIYLKTLHNDLWHPSATTIWAIAQRTFICLGMLGKCKTINKHCVPCQKRMHCLVKQPIMAELLIARVTKMEPYESVSLDYAGPFEIVTKKESKLRDIVQFSILVIVCNSTEAIHLEPTRGQKTTTTIEALACFTCRRGVPKQVISDDGAAFHALKTSVKLAKKGDLIKEGEILSQIDWKIIPGRSPHMNSLAQAAKKSTKGHLFHAIGKQILTVDEVFLVTIRIEAILNSRPLIIKPHEDDLAPIPPAMAIAKRPLIAA
jgi:hypothetical protein